MYSFLKQCAADKKCLLDISDPPHLCFQTFVVSLKWDKSRSINLTTTSVAFDFKSLFYFESKSTFYCCISILLIYKFKNMSLPRSFVAPVINSVSVLNWSFLPHSKMSSRLFKHINIFSVYYLTMKKPIKIQ